MLLKYPNGSSLHLQGCHDEGLCCRTLETSPDQQTQWAATFLSSSGHSKYIRIFFYKKSTKILARSYPGIPLKSKGEIQLHIHLKKHHHHLTPQATWLLFQIHKVSSALEKHQEDQMWHGKSPVIQRAMAPSLYCQPNPCVPPPGSVSWNKVRIQLETTNWPADLFT